MRTFTAMFGLLLTLVASAAHSALPPLSEEIRQLMATDIVTATVVASTSEIVQTGDEMSNRVHHATILVSEVLKGECTEGQMIQATYWRAYERPDFWAGPTGQYQVMELGSDVTAYMVKQSDGQFSLLDPNGFEVASSDMVAVYSAVSESKVMKNTLGARTMKSMIATETYRCPGCFRFDVVSERTDGSDSRTDGFMTSLDLETDEYDVQIAP